MRRKIKLAYIEDAAARKASFKKRKAGLVKKMKELTTLCDVSGCLVIYGEAESVPAVVWPSPDEARHVIRRFREMPEAEQSRRMVDHEEYLRSRIEKFTEQLQKMKRRNDEMEASELMRQLDQGRPLGLFTREELALITWFLDTRMAAIDRRLELIEHPLPLPPARLTLPPPTEDEISGRRDFPCDWANYQVAPPPYHRGDSPLPYILPRELVLGNGNDLAIQPYVPEIRAANGGGYDGNYAGLEENLASGMVIAGEKSEGEDGAGKP